jgi:hypothetical protein
VKYEVFLDYDYIPFFSTPKSTQMSIVKDVQRLIKKFNLEQAKIYVSSKKHKPYHYHVRFKRYVENINDWREVILNSNCCKHFKEYATEFPFTILRIRGTKLKPYLYATITARTCKTVRPA